MYTYAWYHWITFFYIYCFFGWIFESAYVSLKQRRPVNRGFLHLPMLPLYGTGAVMMLWVSLPVQDNLFLVYISGVIAATILEYVTGYVMERLFKVKYWDYSNQRFNLDGYICLSSSIAWGFLTILMTEVIHRPVEHLVLDLQPAVEWGFLTVITVLFTADTISSTREALDLARALEAVTKLRTELDELQVQLALLKAETVQNIQERTASAPRPLSPVSTLLEKSRLRGLRSENLLGLRNAPALGSHILKGVSASGIQAWKQSYGDGLKRLKTSSEAALQLLKESTDTHSELVAKKLADTNQRLMKLLDSSRHKILRRNPGATSRRFADALKVLQEYTNTRPDGKNRED